MQTKTGDRKNLKGQQVKTSDHESGVFYSGEILGSSPAPVVPLYLEDRYTDKDYWPTREGL